MPRERRFGSAVEMHAAIEEWTADHNRRHCGTDRHFTTTTDARVKLKSLYPTRDD